MSGDLIVRLNKDESLSMDFPSQVPVQSHDVSMQALEKLFDGAIKEVLTVPNELIVIFKALDTVLSTNPNSNLIEGLALNGVIVSAWSNDEPYDFASRYFAPNLGIKEDPVTGFMHTILTPYWSTVTGRSHFKAFQASDRTGHMITTLKGDRVILQGNAVKVFETDFRIQF